MKSYLEPDEVKSLEDAANNLRDRLLIRLLSHLGSRVTEALRIAVEDVDLVSGTVTIQHLKTRMRLSCPQCETRLGRSHSFCPKCGSKVEKMVAEEREHRRVRTLPVDRETLDMLQDYIQRGGPVTKDGRQLLFGIGRGQAWRVVSECARRAGLGALLNPDSGRKRGVSPHRLRDAFAVHAMKVDDSGDGLRLLQEHLGHVSFNTTARYRKVAGEEHRQWYDKLWGKPVGEEPLGE
ncbi:MAG: tyrosine-type recombinase/integrase [Chloroflexi bacterium]|nr:tyrosine-type recombinase/integrase [Chloroflexota bacterium]